MDYAVIGGTGVGELALVKQTDITVETPYGRIPIQTGQLGGVELAFLKRHGKGHAIPPHQINYRGNIWALKELGVKKILATGAVGTLSAAHKIGQVVLVDQFLDFTKMRLQTYYEGGKEGVLHVDVSEPYCPNLRQTIRAGADNIGLQIQNGGVYVCTEGPRFETPAEINMFRILGGHVVGMTGVPEVVLARELGLCYATIALVTNAAAGISQEPLTHAEVMATMEMLSKTVAKLIESTCGFLKCEQSCFCFTGNREAGLF